MAILNHTSGDKQGIGVTSAEFTSDLMKEVLKQEQRGRYRIKNPDYQTKNICDSSIILNSRLAPVCGMG